MPDQQETTPASQPKTPDQQEPLPLKPRVVPPRQHKVIPARPGNEAAAAGTLALSMATSKRKAAPEVVPEESENFNDEKEGLEGDPELDEEVFEEVLEEPPPGSLRSQILQDLDDWSISLENREKPSPTDDDTTALRSSSGKGYGGMGCGRGQSSTYRQVDV